MVPAVPAPTWVQLPAGSFVRGRLLTGLFATTHAGGALPALFAVREAFTGPNQTAIPLQGCLALGKAQADLASLRAIVQLTTLACVWPDGRTFEQAIAGYATGRDGTLGLPGRLEQRAGAYLGRTFCFWRRWSPGPRKPLPRRNARRRSPHWGAARVS
jgi:conjugal transfer pilus assembly protein TraB